MTDTDTDLCISQIRDDIDKFEHAAAIAEDIAWDDDCDVEVCHTCGGDGWGIVGTDWDSDDYINGPYDGQITKCPNCQGSGLEKDCWYW